MKSSSLALALFFLLFAFAADPSLASRHVPSLFHADAKELYSDTNYYIVSALRGVVEDELNLIKSANDCPSKSSWPELVGENGKTAAARIEKENPCLRAIVILEGTPVTRDFRWNRVRVWVNKEGKVISVPCIG